MDRTSAVAGKLKIFLGIIHLGPGRVGQRGLIDTDEQGL
jgi:hypothetical protein